MQLRTLSTLCLLTFGILTLPAVNINVTPGSLRSAVSNPTSVTELTLSGSMNVTDFEFISESMTQLQTLDLSDVEIVEYSGQTQSSRTVSPTATIPFGALAGTTIETVTLPKRNLQAIGECAFASSQVRTIVLPNTALVVSDGAFADCQQLTEVTFRAATQLGTAAFKDCTALQTVNGSNRITEIGDYAFFGCSTLSDFDFDYSLSSIGTGAFQRTALTDADLSRCSALQSVGAWAFANNAALQNATFYKSISNLGEGLFFDCPALETVTLPKTCYTLPDYAFTNATALTDADMSNVDLNEIGRFALKGVSSMTKIALPYTLEYIGDNAMEAMSALKVIDATALYTAPELGENVWQGIDQSTVTVLANASTIDEFKTTPQWQDFKFVDDEDAVSDITATASPAIKGCFIGTRLIVKTENIELKQLSLYNIAGTLLATNYGRSETAEFETADYTDMIYIVVAVLPDNRTASLKIAR